MIPDEVEAFLLNAEDACRNGNVGLAFQELIAAVRKLSETAVKTATANGEINGEAEAASELVFSVECFLLHHESCVMTPCSCACHRAN